MEEPASGTGSRRIKAAKKRAVIVRTTSRFIAPARHIIPVARQEEEIPMKRAQVFQQNQLAGVLECLDDGTYRFTYEDGFRGEPVSLTMPTNQRTWNFPRFPAPFEGLLPEGVQLDGLLRIRKLDQHDLFGQLLAVGHDVVGSLRFEAIR